MGTVKGEVKRSRGNWRQTDRTFKAAFLCASEEGWPPGQCASAPDLSLSPPGAGEGAWEHNEEFCGEGFHIQLIISVGDILDLSLGRKVIARKSV